jgi:hypothetical protein
LVAPRALETTKSKKPRGLLHPRVQQIGSEHFGIVCFDDFWDSAIPRHLLRHDPTAASLAHAVVTNLCQSLRNADIRCQQRTIQGVVVWAHQAAPGDTAAHQHLRIVQALHDDGVAIGAVSGRRAFRFLVFPGDLGTMPAVAK